eukprot:SAG31_NODE_41_length_31342_cov_8.029286_27_plen_160_part_00
MASEFYATRLLRCAARPQVPLLHWPLRALARRLWWSNLDQPYENQPKRRPNFRGFAQDSFHAHPRLRRNARETIVWYFRQPVVVGSKDPQTTWANSSRSTSGARGHEMGVKVVKYRLSEESCLLNFLKLDRRAPQAGYEYLLNLVGMDSPHGHHLPKST